MIIFPVIISVLVDNQTDLDKIEIIFKHRKGVMYDEAFNILKNKEDAEDAVQTALIYLAFNISSIEDPLSGKTRSFLITITRYRALNIYRSNKKRWKHELTAGTVEKIASFAHIDKVEWDEIEDERIANALSKMKSEYRIVVELKAIYEIKLTEIAELMEISYWTVSKRFQRGKKEMKKYLREEGLL